MNRVFLWLCTFVWGTLIFWNSVSPKVPGADLGINYYGYILHFAVYAVLSFLIFTSLRFDVEGKRASQLAVITAFLYGVLLELLQHFIPYRSASLIDASINGLGALVVQLPFMLKWNLKNSFQRKRL
jgi:VanZ family protein